jgi:hypothetical protein
MSDVIPASHADLLESPALAHVATIGPSGEPQVSPVRFTTQYAPCFAGLD